MKNTDEMSELPKDRNEAISDLIEDGRGIDSIKSYLDLKKLEPLSDSEMTELESKIKERSQSEAKTDDKINDEELGLG